MHGRTRSPHWSWDGQAEVQSLQSNRHGLPYAEGIGLQTPVEMVTDYVPKADACSPAAVSPAKGNRVAWLSEEQTKRFRITVRNEAGDEEQRRMSMKFTTLAILTTVKSSNSFRCHRGTNVRDMRTRHAPLA